VRSQADVVLEPWLAFVLTKELEEQSFNYRLFYKEWSAVALDELLKLSDGFFLNVIPNKEARK
jgi:hypothetical protein